MSKYAVIGEKKEAGSSVDITVGSANSSNNNILIIGVIVLFAIVILAIIFGRKMKKDK